MVSDGGTIMILGRVLNVGLQDGGPAGMIYGFLFCWAGYAAVVASLAELVSAIPTAGGEHSIPTFTPTTC